ncbi:MAG TPA: WD40 repeat domain-containing protein, partial [Isosphaeraceae bacterium]|nr:WD40 repeat domain-containing protein [Isosphaeraceae bacterium]
MRKRDCAWFLALCLALPVLSAEAQPVPAQDVPQADELVAEDTAALDLDVPDGAEVSLGGVAQGARRRIELKPFPVGRYVPYAVRVRFAGGGELTRTVLLHGGWRVRLPIAAPGTFRPEVVPQTGHDVGVWSVAWSPDGRQALTGSLDGSAILWDAASGLQLRTFRGRALAVRSVAFSLDGKRVAVAGEGDPTDPKGDVTVFDTATGREHLRFDGHRGGVWGVAFSPDGRFLLTGSEDGTAILWNAATAQRLRTFARDGHSAPILAVAFSADGTEVLTGSRDHAAMLWDVASGLKARSFTGHTEAVRAVAFRPGDGPAQVATASYDGTARLWDASTGASLHTLKGHTKPVRALAYRHDGRTLFTGSSDGVLIEW